MQHYLAYRHAIALIASSSRTGALRGDLVGAAAADRRAQPPQVSDVARAAIPAGAVLRARMADAERSAWNGTAEPAWSGERSVRVECDPQCKSGDKGFCGDVGGL